MPPCSKVNSFEHSDDHLALVFYCTESISATASPSTSTPPFPQPSTYLHPPKPPSTPTSGRPANAHATLTHQNLTFRRGQGCEADQEGRPGHERARRGDERSGRHRRLAPCERHLHGGAGASAQRVVPTYLPTYITHVQTTQPACTPTHLPT